jgi:hypothetical protein
LTGVIYYGVIRLGLFTEEINAVINIRATLSLCRQSLHPKFVHIVDDAGVD